MIVLSAKEIAFQKHLAIGGRAYCPSYDTTLQYQGEQQDHMP
jgi:hypothetical protein